MSNSWQQQNENAADTPRARKGETPHELVEAGKTRRKRERREYKRELEIMLHQDDIDVMVDELEDE